VFHSLNTSSWVNYPVSGTWPAVRYGHVSVLTREATPKLIVYGGAQTEQIFKLTDMNYFHFNNKTWEAVSTGGSGVSGYSFNSAVVNSANQMIIFGK
jgi:hypothetical protein